MQLGQMIVKIRKESKLTQEEFAEKFDVTRQTVSNWENEKSYPDLLTLVKISDEFGCSLDTMLKENPIMTKETNKKTKYGEESASVGGISAIFLFIIAIAMVILQYGSIYIAVAFLIITFVNMRAISAVFDSVKKEGKRTISLFVGLYVIFTIIVFGVIYLIR